MRRMTGRRARTRSSFGVAAVLVLLVGCAPQAGPGDWALEPVPWQTAVAPADISYGMQHLAADLDGGFWGESGGNWVHVAADGASERIRIDDPARVTGVAALSPTALVVAHEADGAPVLSVLDTRTMTTRELPGAEPQGTGDATDLGDWIFGDVAVESGDAIVVRYQPGGEGFILAELLRVDLDSGARTALFSEPLPLDDGARGSAGVPPVSIDARDGFVYMSTPDARIVLSADGTEISRARQAAEHPQVAANPDGTVLWWGGPQADSSARSVILGGSSQARDAIERRSACERADVIRTDGLLLSDRGGEQHPLPFLCGANAAVWSGSSWVVAIGGEGDGVLVRLVPPKNR